MIHTLAALMSAACLDIHVKLKPTHYHQTVKINWWIIIVLLIFKFSSQYSVVCIMIEKSDWLRVQ